MKGRDIRFHGKCHTKFLRSKLDGELNAFHFFDFLRVKPADFKQFVFLPADLLVGILEKDAVLIEFPYIKIGIGKIFHFDCFMTGRVSRRNRKKKVLPL